MFALGLALVVVVSLLTPAPAIGKIEGHLWRPQDAAATTGQPWYQDYRVQAAALAVLTVAIVVCWW